MLIVHGHLPAWGVCSPSPFVLKLVAWLDAKGLDATLAPADLGRAPKGKYPWIELDGEALSDSGDIIDALTARFGPLPGDLRRAPTDPTLHLVRRTLEESLSFATLTTRWAGTDEAFEAVVAAFTPALPPVIGPAALRWVVRPQVRKAARAQGMARHDAAGIAARATADLRAIAGVLGQGPWLAGPDPGSVDCALWAFLTQLAVFPAPSATKSALLDDPALANLRAVVENGKPRFPRAWIGEPVATPR